MHTATSRVVGASGSARNHLHRVGRRRAALQRRIEVGDHHVVGLDRLEAPGLQRAAVGRGEDQRRGGVAHAPVLRHGRLALRLRRRARRPARRLAVPPVGSLHLRIVVRGLHQRLRVDLVAEALERGQHAVVGVEKQCGCELRELERAEHLQLAAGGAQPRRDHHAAGEPGAGQALARLGRERHAPAAEHLVPGGHPLRRPARRFVTVSALRQPDQPHLPLELVAEPPAQQRQRRRGRVCPWAMRIGEVRDGDRGGGHALIVGP